MVYIFVEDSTSGFDIIKTVIERVIKPTVPYMIYSLYGCSNIIQLQNVVDGTILFNFKDVYLKITGSDVVVLYVDNVSSYTAFLTQLKRKAKAHIYCSDYYCFESVLFSYNFCNCVFGDSCFEYVYKNFKNMLLNKNFTDFSKLRGYLNNDMLSLTYEQLANRIFVRYWSKVPCVIINKTSYKQTLDDCLLSCSIGKAYYNSLCGSKELKLYCNSMHKNGRCKMCNRRSKFGLNLRDFYYNSLLHNKLLAVGEYDDVFLHDLLR